MGIIAKNIGKQVGTPAVRILSDLSLTIEDGEFVSLTGKSGSEKSTLLYILSSLDTPSEGSVHVSGKDLNLMESEELYQFRNQQMGFVFQFHYLIAELSVLENVLMPTLKLGKQVELKSYAESLLEQFGLKENASISEAIIRRRRAACRDRPSADHETEIPFRRRAYGEPRFRKR